MKLICSFKNGFSFFFTCKIGLVLFLILFFSISSGQAKDIELEQIVRALNLSRQLIRSGELKVMYSSFKPARIRSDEDLKRWREASRKRFREADREEDMEEHIRMLEKLFTQALEVYEERDVAFERIGNADEASVKLSEPQLNVKFREVIFDRKNIDLNSEEARYFHAGYQRIITWDEQIQAVQNENRIIPPYIEIYDSLKRGGFLPYSFLGRTLIFVSADKTELLGQEKVDGELCYVLKYHPKLEIEEEVYAKFWIIAEKGFSVCKEEWYYSSKLGLSIHSYEFRQFSGIWYPTKWDYISKNPKSGELTKRESIIVKEVEFNVDFPDDFFATDLEKIMESGLTIDNTSDIKLKPTHSQSKKTATKIPLDCGPKSLLIVSNLLGVHATLEELSNASNLDPKRGTTMLGLYRAAKEKGLTPLAIKLEKQDLDKLKTPAIVHVNGNHFLVVEKIKGSKVTLRDPSGKYNSLSTQQFAQIWSGNALIFNVESSMINKEKMLAARKKDDKSNALPSIKFDSISHNFGEVDAETTLEHVFRFKNDGQGILRITKIKSDCACTATLLSSKEILPGQSGNFKVRYISSKDSGKEHKVIRVYTNDPENPIVKLAVIATVDIPIAAFPKRLFVGSIAIDKLSSKELTIRRFRDKAEILNIHTSSKYIGVNILSKVNNDTKLKITFSPKLPIGFLNEKLLVDFRYNEKKSVLEVPVIGEILGDIKVLPKRVFFGFVDRQQNQSQTVTLFTTEGKPFELLSIKNDSSYITVEFKTLEKEKQYQIRASVTPNAPFGELFDTIKVQTNSLKQPLIKIPVYGIVK